MATLKLQISKLKKENEELKRQNVALSSKIEAYKDKADKYDTLAAVFESQKAGNQQTVLINNDEMVMIDPSHPTVTIKRYQLNMVVVAKDFQNATRMMLDFLFEPEAYIGKNYTFIRDNYPEKVGALISYVSTKFPGTKKGTFLKQLQISAAISDVYDLFYLYI